MDLTGPGYQVSRSNLLVLESKADMQNRGQASPDGRAGADLRACGGAGGSGGGRRGGCNRRVWQGACEQRKRQECARGAYVIAMHGLHHRMPAPRRKLTACGLSNAGFRPEWAPGPTLRTDGITSAIESRSSGFELVVFHAQNKL